MSDGPFDVAVVGAGPAGAMLAHCLAKKDHRVLLLEREAFPRSVTCSGWVSSKVATMLGEVEIAPGKVLSEPFTDVTIYSGDLAKRAVPEFADAPGFLVDRASFDKMLVDAAVAAGATFAAESPVEDIKLNESSVKLSIDGGATFESRLLMLAAGRSSPLPSLVGFPPSPGAAVWVAHVETKTPKAKAPKAPRVSIVLGLDGASSFALICVSKKQVSIDVNWIGAPEAAVGALVNLCKAGAANDVLPVDLTELAVKAKPQRSPASAALDMDSHVRKHTLLIGDAGGFVSAVSNEGIYPAMWSARIAAEVLDTALASKHSQDELMAFDSAWRVKMADYLRSPHTDVRVLLPLVVSNQPMADRMAAAFFFGENI